MARKYARAQAVGIFLLSGFAMGAVYKDVDGTETRTAIPKLLNGKTMVFFEQYPVRFLKADDIDEHGPHGTVSCMPNGSVYLQIGGTTVINSNPVEGVDYEWQPDKK